MNKQLVRQQHRKARSTKFAGGWVVFIPPNRTLGVGDTPAAAWRAAALALVRQTRSNVRARVDQLIDWHLSAKIPCKPIRVQATANTIRKFARKRGGFYRYRDQIIVPTRKTRSRIEIAAENNIGATRQIY